MIDQPLDRACPHSSTPVVTMDGNHHHRCVLVHIATYGIAVCPVPVPRGPHRNRVKSGNNRCIPIPFSPSSKHFLDLWVVKSFLKRRFFSTVTPENGLIQHLSQKWHISKIGFSHKYSHVFLRPSRHRAQCTEEQMHPSRSRQRSELDLSVFLITLQAVYVVSADQPHLVAVFLQQRPQPGNVVPNDSPDQPG